jgi:hypothetical protein
LYGNALKTDLRIKTLRADLLLMRTFVW